MDADFKVRLKVTDTKRIEAVRETLRERGFRALDDLTFSGRHVDVELYPIEDRHDEEALERRIRARLLASLERDFWLVTAEDLVLTKLREYRRSRDYKHVDDVRKLLVARADALDLHYLAERVLRYELGAVWREQIAQG